MYSLENLIRGASGKLFRYKEFRQITDYKILFRALHANRWLDDSAHSDFTSTHWFSALYVSHWLEHLVLDDSYKAPTWKSYFGRFRWIIGSKFLSWAIHTKYFLILGASCDLWAQKSHFESFIQGISYFRHFMKITSSEILLWVIWTKYWLINITLGTLCKLPAQIPCSE